MTWSCVLPEQHNRACPGGNGNSEIFQRDWAQESRTHLPCCGPLLPPSGGKAYLKVTRALSAVGVRVRPAPHLSSAVELALVGDMSWVTASHPWGCESQRADPTPYRLCFWVSYLGMFWRAQPVSCWCEKTGMLNNSGTTQAQVQDFQ